MRSVLTRLPLLLPSLVLLGVASAASGVVVNATHVSNGDINGNSVTFLLNSSVDSISGDFAGTFEIQGDPAFLAAVGDGFFAELTIPPWDYKLLFQPDDDLSLYELSGFEFFVETDTTFVDDAAGSHVGALSVAGNATNADYVHTFTESVSVSNGATRWTALTHFFPMGPGLVGFETAHLANGGTPFSETTGQISFGGNPAASLAEPFFTHFTSDFAFTDNDPDDGVLAGTLEGTIRVSAGPIPVPIGPAATVAIAAALLGFGRAALGFEEARRRNSACSSSSSRT